MTTTGQDEEYFIPLQDQRVFGAGIKRKRVPFVPSGSSLSNSDDSATTTTTKTNTKVTVGSIYESIVLPSSSSSTPKTTTTTTTSSTNNDQTNNPTASQKTEEEEEVLCCDICHLPLPAATTTPKPHEASLAHQACLSHSHPPSHLDRRHKGLQYLASYGWDPDDRRGLGVQGEGRLFPVKSRVKNDTMGVGFKLPKDGKMTPGKVEEKKKKLLDAKRIRVRDDEQRKRADRLQRMFYQSEELNRYLGVERE